MVKTFLIAGFAIVAASTSVMTASCGAAITFLGPTPYFSKADSPFPVEGSNPNFFLEDFEPPANLPPGGFVIGKFSPPGAIRETGGIQAGSSIGEDDHVNGSGRNGWCGSLATRLVTGTESSLNMFGVDFDAQTLGFYPTAVGFVVTHGASQYSGFSIYNPFGVRKDFSLQSIDVSTLNQGGGDFVGVVDAEGISRIEILQTIIYNVTTPDEIVLFDHFQYGLFVPEPSGLALICWVVAIAGASLRSCTFR